MFELTISCLAFLAATIGFVWIRVMLRLRNNAKNGLAVVPVDRDACGGCFNKIPPQRQLDIDAKKKVIVCEHCGRVLVPGDNETAE